MATFFAHQLDYIFFFYGFGFILLAGICFGLQKSKTARLGWSWLGWFGLIHGINEWLDLLAMSFGDNVLFSGIRVSVLIVSFLCLMEFGRVGACEVRGKGMGRWIFVPLCLLVGLGGCFGMAGINASARLVLGFGGGFWAAIAIFRYSVSCSRECRPWLPMTGLFLVIYSMAAGLVISSEVPFLPDFWLTQSTFLLYLKFPVQLLRGVCACCVALSVWGYLHVTSKSEVDTYYYSARSRHALWTAVSLMLVVGMGWILTEYLGQRGLDTLKHHDEDDVSVLSAFVHGELSEVQNGSRAMAGSPWIAPALSSGRPQDIERANSVLKRYADALHAQLCYLLDKEGIAVASSNDGEPNSLIGHDYSFRPYFQKAISGEAGRYFAKGVTTAKRGFYASHPVYDELNRSVLGVAVVKRSLTTIEEALSLFPYCFLVDPHGIVFLAGREEMTLKSLWPLEDGVRRTLTESNQFGPVSFEPILHAPLVDGEETTLQGHRFVTTRRILDPEGWSLILLSPVEPVKADRLIGILITLSISMLVLSFYSASQRLAASSFQYAASQANYRSIFDAVSEGILIIEPTTNQVLDVNSKAAEMYGYGMGEARKLALGDLHDDSSQDGPDEFLSRMRAALDGESQFFEWPTRSRDGRSIWTEIHLRKALISGKERLLIVLHDVSARREAEQARRESERCFREILENIRLLAVTLDVEGRIVFCNDFLLELTGWQEVEILGQDWFDLFAGPESRADLRAFFRKGMEAGEILVHIQNEILTRTGESLTVEWINTVMRGPHGAIEGSTSIGIDITERSKAEEALRESERFLDRLIENIPNMISVKDAEDLRFVRFNKAGEELLGYSREEVMGKTVHSLFPEDVADFITKKDRQALDLNRLVDVPESLVPTRVLGERILHTKNIPILDEAGNAQYVLGISEDITERKRSEEENALLATMVEQAEENVLVTDCHRTILYINPAFERSSGYTCDELKGRKLRVLRSDQHDDNFYRAMKETLDRGDVWLGVIVNKGKDGTDFEIEGTISPLRDPGGAITHHVAVGRNMSRFRKLERELQQVQKMESLGILAGGIAHDFNNVLAAIMGFVELELLTTPEEGKSRHRLEQALAACGRARDLVKQILTFSRHGEERLSPLNLEPLVKEALKMLRATLPATIELRLNIEDTQSVILGDPIRIHQVLINLCTNAAYALRDAGGLMEIGLASIEVASEKASDYLDLKPGPYVRLTVSDTGHGMNRETLERIFEPFFTTKDPGEGTGMGLAVVHGIVKSHGGTIKAYSEPGKGASFQVYFPRITSSVEPMRKLAVPYSSGKERILLVDDEQVITAAVGDMLTALGYEVVSVNRSLEALELFRSRPDGFDLVITDLTMPAMTGIEMTVEILRIRKDIPVILNTGFTNHQIRERAQSSGIRHILTKPCILHELADTVREALDWGKKPK